MGHSKTKGTASDLAEINIWEKHKKKFKNLNISVNSVTF